MDFALCWLILFSSSFLQICPQDNFISKLILWPIKRRRKIYILLLTNSLNLFYWRGLTLLVKAVITQVRIAMKKKKWFFIQKSLTGDIFRRWHVTVDMWHATYDKLHKTHETQHVTIHFAICCAIIRKRQKICCLPYAGFKKIIFPHTII